MPHLIPLNFLCRASILAPIDGPGTKMSTRRLPRTGTEMTKRLRKRKAVMERAAVEVDRDPQVIRDLRRERITIPAPTSSPTMMNGTWDPLGKGIHLSSGPCCRDVTTKSTWIPNSARASWSPRIPRLVTPGATTAMSATASSRTPSTSLTTSTVRSTNAIWGCPCG